MIVINTDLQFTVACSVEGKFDLTREMKMIKPVLLYADKITLISPTAYTVLQIEQITQCKNEKDAIFAFKKLTPYVAMASPKVAQDYENAFNQILPYLSSKKYNSLSFLKRLEFKKSMISCMNSVKQSITNGIGVQNDKEMKQLISSGHMKVETFDSSIYQSEQMIFEYITLLTNALSNSNSLLDEDAYALVQGFSRKEILTIDQRSSCLAKHAGLVSNLLSTLPSIDKASVDELLDIKRSLNIPLQRFRSTLLTYSQSLNELPWNEDFERECLDLYIKEINPKIIEIEEYMHENKYIIELMTAVTDAKQTWVYASGIAIGIAANGIMPTLQQAIHFDSALYATGGVYVVEKLVKAYIEYKKKHDEIKKKDMYFYVKAKQKLNG